MKKKYGILEESYSDAGQECYIPRGAVVTIVSDHPEKKGMVVALVDIVVGGVLSETIKYNVPRKILII